MSIVYFLLLLMGLAIIAYLIYQPALVKYRRKKIKHQEFPKAWDDKLMAQWPLYTLLPDLLKQGIQERIMLFLSEKKFIGCNGFEVSEHHKVLIAAQACLLIINKPYEYFDKLKFILIYPSAFIVSRNQHLENGTVSETRSINSGEAWENGKIILSWDDAYSGMINMADGHNVVFHEFAHLLDHTNGSANGAPLLEHAKNYQQWSHTFTIAFKRLQQSINQGRKTLFNPYGATNPGEFFAVASELFFEKSKSLEQQEPDLHQQLVKFYAVDPTLW